MKNQLQYSPSPYLLQHANNPVFWQMWNDENITKADQSGKLMLISIGYAACHWCHVMAHECFEDIQVAEVMNKYFTNFKIDRKSTRLNSSHVKISYAVFCLKKKMIQ